MKRASVATEYFNQKNTLDSSRAKCQEIEIRVQDLVDKENDLRDLLNRLSEEVTEILEASSNSEREQSISSLELRLKELSNELVREKAKCDIENDQIQRDKKLLAQLVSQLSNVCFFVIFSEKPIGQLLRTPKKLLRTYMRREKLSWRRKHLLSKSLKNLCSLYQPV